MTCLHRIFLLPFKMVSKAPCCSIIYVLSYLDIHSLKEFQFIGQELFLLRKPCNLPTATPCPPKDFLCVFSDHTLY